MSSVPIHPRDFNLTWLERALKAETGALRSFDFDPIGTGQMCQSFRLNLKWRRLSEGPAAIIAKCPSADEKTRAAAQTMRSYTLELNWYRDLAGKIPVACPQCLHAERADGDKVFVLLLQDLSPARQGDQLAGASPQAIDAALEQAARLHAAHWSDPALPQIPWLAESPTARSFLLAALPSYYAAFRERYASRLAPEILELGDAMIARMDRYFAFTPQALTLQHRDFRIDNLLFTPDGRVFVLDWQTIGLGAGVLDVAYLIGTSIADKDLRAAHEQAWVGRYSALLSSFGAAHDPEALWKEYRLYALSGFVMAIVAAMNVVRTERGDEMFAVMAERPARQALSLDSLSLL